MLKFALNHRTVPSLTMDQTVALAVELGLVGVELRNDLGRPLFDGRVPTRDAMGGMTILALAEVKAFNAFDETTFDAAVALMDLAVQSGAQAIALIPQVGGEAVSPDGLRVAMQALGPELAKRGLMGLIEPIGFAASSLRSKSDVVALIEELGVSAQFGLVHDTFHHYLSGDETIYPEHTKLVHISGIPNHDIAIADICDADRVLVDVDDRLGNITQITDLLRGGYDGPFSFEAFSPDVHALHDPKAALSRSIRFIENSVMALAA